MDILNWLYLKTAGLVKTQINDPASDLIVLGAQVPFTTRDDGYQTYGITVADFAATLGASGGLVDVSYNDLYNKVVNEELVPGQWYRLTDYRSVNFLNGYEIATLNANYNSNPATNPNFNPRDIYTGFDEVLLLQAVSPNEIAHVGYSETYPDDIIQYEPLTNAIGLPLQISNGFTLPNSNVVSGFDLQWDGTNVYFDIPSGYLALFGQPLSIYCEFNDGVNPTYYQNGIYFTTAAITKPEISFTTDNSVFQYPKATTRIVIENSGTKVILLDLDFNDFNNYQANTLFVSTVYAEGAAYGLITRRQDALRKIDTPFDFRNRVYRRFEVDLSAVNPSLGVGYYGQGDDFGGFGTTGNFGDFKVFENALNLTWEGLAIGSSGIGENDNNVFLNFINDAVIQNGFANNTMGTLFSNTSSIENVRIDNYFRLNTVGSGFKNNVIGNSSSENLIGRNFELNTTYPGFRGNIVLNNFRRNDVKVGISFNNFTSATHVYGNYNCELFRRVGGGNRLSYIDGSDNFTVTSITA